MVALHDARFFGRRVGEHVNDRDTALQLADLHADPTVATAGATLELVRALGRVQLGVRIVELVYQPLGRFLVQGRGVERVNELLVDELHHFLKDQVAVAGHVGLDHEPTSDQRYEYERTESQRAKPGATKGRHAKYGQGDNTGLRYEICANKRGCQRQRLDPHSAGRSRMRGRQPLGYALHTRRRSGSSRA